MFILYQYRIFYFGEAWQGGVWLLSKTVAIGQRFRVRSFYLDVINLLDMAARVSTAHFLSRVTFFSSIGAERCRRDNNVAKLRRHSGRDRC